MTSLEYWEPQWGTPPEGLDHDLETCLFENEQTLFELKDIGKVLTVVVGKYDEEPWHWILQLKDGRFIYLVACHDCSGWDCRSNASSMVLESLDKFPEIVVDVLNRDIKKIEEGQQLYVELYICGDCPQDQDAVRESLLRQIVEKKKDPTWREQTDGGFSPEHLRVVKEVEKISE